MSEEIRQKALKIEALLQLMTLSSQLIKCSALLANYALLAQKLKVTPVELDKVEEFDKGCNMLLDIIRVQGLELLK